jgi:Chalcone isomerase-like
VSGALTSTPSSTPTSALARQIMVLGTVFQLFQFGDDSGSSSQCVALAEAVAGTDSACSSPSLASSAQHNTTHLDEDVIVEGIALPPARVLADDGMPLYRNGHGIRSIPFFGMNIKVYVAHLYSRKPLNEDDALALIDQHPKVTAAPSGISPNHNTTRETHHHHNPLHFDFTFLRHVGQSRVVSAWTQQLEYSVTHRYEGYEQDRDRFIQLFSTGHIDNGGTQTVQLVGEETRLIDQGQHKGTIEGRDFQKSFLSMWVGPKAVAEDLKRNLFQGHGRSQQQQQQENRMDCGSGSESDWIPLTEEESPKKATPVAA